MWVPINSCQLIDGDETEISQLVKTHCNVIAPFRAGKAEEGFWCMNGAVSMNV